MCVMCMELVCVMCMELVWEAWVSCGFYFLNSMPSPPSLPPLPLLTLRHIPRPSLGACLLSPKSLASTHDHNANLRRLVFLQKCFQKRDLWSEVAIFERLYYKNKNQHRHTGYWRRLCEVGFPIVNSST